MKLISCPDGRRLKHAWILLRRGCKQPTLIVLVFFETEADAKAYAEDVLGLGGAGYSTYEMKRTEAAA